MKFVISAVLVFLSLHPNANIYGQGFDSLSSIGDITITTSTAGEKPQSKVWKYNGEWYAVIPVQADNGDAAGSWLWRLNGSTWEKRLRLSSSTTAQADALVDGDYVFILLYDGTSDSKFLRLHYDSGDYSIVGSLVSVPLGGGVETATIALDSDNRLWVAYESDNDINVRYSDPSYSGWSSEIVLETNVYYDDICAVTAFGGDKIGVLWSNQVAEEFGFAYHNDGDGSSSGNWHYETAISDNSYGEGSLIYFHFGSE